MIDSCGSRSLYNGGEGPECIAIVAVMRHELVFFSPVWCGTRGQITTDRFAAERLQKRGTDHQLPANYTIFVLALWFIGLVGWCEFKPKIDAFLV
jgi:hypothetical protein